MHRYRIAVSMGLMFLCALTVACSNDNRFKAVYPARGQVLYDGKPPVGAVVSFHLVGEDHPWTKPSALVGEDGWFTVTTYRENDGVPEGQYQVTVIWLPPGWAGSLEAGNKLPAKYADKTKSGLTVEVKRGEGVLPVFNLTKS